MLDVDEAAALLSLTNGLERATVSACPPCRSRIVAAVALVDLARRPRRRSPAARELVELADDAPTLHLTCATSRRVATTGAWRDPGYEEWDDVIADLVPASPTALTTAQRGMRGRLNSLSGPT